MKKIALISYANSKKNGFSFIKDIDKENQLYKLSLEYANKYADEVYILSARYGLLRENQYTPSCDESLNYKSEVDIKLWSLGILNQLNENTDIHNDNYIILADKHYYRNFIDILKYKELLFESMTLEEKILLLRKESSKKGSNNIFYGEKLHRLFNSMKKYDYTNLDNISFQNGIYIILDKKEKYKCMNRIVRIGTHTSEDMLISKIKNHYDNNGKDLSILRKNIGKAILTYNNHYYLYIWNINFNDKENEEKYTRLRDMEVENSLEEKITNYIKERYEFVCFEVKDKEKRISLEEGLISTICNCRYFRASDTWLGNYSPVKEIRDSGMWILREFDKNKLTEEEFVEIVTLCMKSSENIKLI